MCNEEVVRIKKEFTNKLKQQIFEAEWGEGEDEEGVVGKGKTLRRHLVLLLRDFGRVWMQNWLKTKDNNKDYICHTMCEADWGEGDNEDGGEK